MLAVSRDTRRDDVAPLVSAPGPGSAATSSVLIVMGVSGVGKSTIAEALAARLGWAFQEGDALHPPINIAKMRAGVPLDDQDRAPWLRAVKHWIDARLAADKPGLVTCSALKRHYRDSLVAGSGRVRLLYLHADRALLADRLAHRTGHFMPASLLDSQLATLEEPAAEERPITVQVHGVLTQTVAAALDAIGAALSPGPGAPARAHGGDGPGGPG